MKVYIIFLTLLIVFTGIKADLTHVLNSLNKEDFEAAKKMDKNSRLMLLCYIDSGLKMPELLSANSKTDQRVRNFCRCYQYETGWLNDDGTYNKIKTFEELLPNLPMEHVEKINNKCNTKVLDVEDNCLKVTDFEICCKQELRILRLNDPSLLEDVKLDKKDICLLKAIDAVPQDKTDLTKPLIYCRKIYEDCVITKNGMLNDDGTVNEEHVYKEYLSDIPLTKAKRFFKKCRHTNNNSQTEMKYWNFLTCVNQEKKVLLKHEL